MNVQELKAAAEAALFPDTDEEITYRGHMPRLFAYYQKAEPAIILKLIAVVEAVEYSDVAKSCQMLSDALKELEK